MLKYDDVLNRQREAIYGDRRRILEGDDLHERTQNFLAGCHRRGPRRAHRRGTRGRLGPRRAVGRAQDALPDLDHASTRSSPRPAAGTRSPGSCCEEEILSDARLAYERRDESLGEPAMRELERRVVLSVIDRRWRDHLYEMDYLKDGIGLRAMAQRDPLVEYQREGFSLFQTMMGQIREESIGFLFNLEVEVNAGGDATAAVPQVAAKGLSGAGAAAEKLSYSAPIGRRRGRGAQPARPDRAGRHRQGPSGPGRGGAGAQPAFGGRVSSGTGGANRRGRSGPSGRAARRSGARSTSC